ncbi:RNA 2',3'-cyclic phosphodiesterase [Paenibacillus oleatilyticus]|uniref:RNA 2',3'-cyclic phosphodiesterase n=1 Tax=Paenibacillus oleatilyticus TaxID=2594886 RepID=UPI001C1FCD4A|nr:RNA 2',3'-cyclic phosphodiesterase [Paenibacillus oleatilyticus]MBU7320087.1 RNA 2',3'-cyclic phosphodiesterase [Paenibacillus oleatilyticus]
MEPSDRLFVAVPAPPSVISSAESWVLRLKDRFSFAKWVHPQDLHLTLQFLGDVARDRTERIAQAIAQAVKDTAPFSLHFQGLGVFGKPNAPSVLWAGVQGEVEKLGQLQRRIVDAMEPLGFAAENCPYKPHLTLARKFTGPAGSHAAMLDVALPDEWQTPWRVEETVLYRSRLGRRPMYERVASLPLG